MKKLLNPAASVTTWCHIMPSYLVRNRNGNYYCRMPIPQALKARGAPSEVRQSLFTKIRCIAIERNLLVTFDLRMRIETLLRDSSCMGSISSELRKKISQKRIEIAVGNIREELALEQREHRKQMLKLSKELESEKSKTAKSKEIASKLGSIARRATHDVQLAEQRDLLNKGMIEKLTSPYKAITLAQAVDEYLVALSKEDKNGDLRDEKYVKKAKTRLLPFVSYYGGDKLVRDITEANDVEQIRSLFFKYPANAKSFKGQYSSIEELIAIAAQQDPNYKRLSTRTIKHYILGFSGFLSKCVKQGYLSRNIFVGESPTNDRLPHEQRAVFTSKQLITIFSHPRYTSGKATQAVDYWMPLIMLLNGMRPQEVCQLKLSDICLKENVWCFDIKITDKELQKLKSKKAVRLIPINEKLIELGLIAYTQSVNSEWLFPDAKPANDGNEWATNPGQRFNKPLAKYMDKGDDKLDLYSLRHTHGNVYFQADKSDEHASDMMGHESKSGTQTNQRYRSGLNMDVKLQTIRLINFDNELATVPNWVNWESMLNKRNACSKSS